MAFQEGPHPLLQVRAASVHTSLLIGRLSVHVPLSQPPVKPVEFTLRLPLQPQHRVINLQVAVIGRLPQCAACDAIHA